MRHEPTTSHEDPSLSYRVTWRSVDEAGKSYEEVFTNRDHAWDFKVDKEKSPNAYSITWEHLTA